MFDFKKIAQMLMKGGFPTRGNPRKNSILNKQTPNGMIGQMPTANGQTLAQILGRR